jgi:hypothetical protein
MTQLRIARARAAAPYRASGLVLWHIPAIGGRIVDGRAATRPKSCSGETSTTKNGEGSRIMKAIPYAHDRLRRRAVDPAKVAQMVEVLNGLTARDALCLLVGCILTVLDRAPSDEERQQSLDSCIDLLRCTKDRL